MEQKRIQKSTNQENEIVEISAMEMRDRDLHIKKLVEAQKALIEELAQARAALRHYPEFLASNLAVIVTNAWKARTKMMDGDRGQPREEMRRIYRHIETMFDAFQQIGLQIKVHTGDAFDYGLPLTVITTQPTPGIAKERVIETIKPTIYWNDTIIQTGEVVIATPVQL
ncbi:MAG: hypothetical protein ABSH48_21440 [Verrucomicrobiota bacterium]|jgi:hypothetical protein